MAMLSRRQSLGMLGSAGLAAVAPAGIPVAFAAAPTDRRLLVLILRGGLDGLAAVPPYADPDYRAQRGGLALAEPGSGEGVLDLDGRFGLHPALEPLHALYRQQQLLVFHAVATPYRERSHFDAQDLLENGTGAPRGADDGWLNRALSLYGKTDRRLGLAVGQTTPLILRGAQAVGSWAPRVLPRIGDDFLTRLAALYRQDALLGPALAEGIRAQEMSDELLGRDMGGGTGKSRKRLRGAGALPVLVGNTGKLLADARGPRIAVLEVGGWDTHANQGLLTGGLARNLKALAEGVAGLKAAMASVWDRTAVLVVTEFGRTVRPNGTNGTDHGTAGVAFLAGGGLAGGRVVTQWPGLAGGKLYEDRDLAPTMDLRAVFKAVLAGHLDLPEPDIDRHVFPDSHRIPRLRAVFRS
jgi:uncharacterized protein (DUF1501 family)